MLSERRSDHVGIRTSKEPLARRVHVRRPHCGLDHASADGFRGSIEVGTKHASLRHTRAQGPFHDAQLSNPVVGPPQASPSEAARSLDNLEGPQVANENGRSASSRRSRIFCGAAGDRTPDLMTASHALSQLSYGPRNGWRKVPRTLKLGEHKTQLASRFSDA